jgi:hypothetical protein
MIHAMPHPDEMRSAKNAAMIVWQSAAKRANQSLQAARHQKVILFTNS